MWTDAARSNERTRRAISWLVAGLLLASAAHARALSTDSDQPIAIEADRAEHDDAKRITIYRENVIIDQGSLHITGDTVTIHFDGQDEVTKITAVGAPAHFRQLPEGDIGHRKAWAKRMEYFPEQDLIVLLGEARYEKDWEPRTGGPARIRFAQRAFQGADGYRGGVCGRRRPDNREEARTRQDPDQAEEGPDAVGVRCTRRRSGERPRTDHRWQFSPRADSRNATETAWSSTM